LPKTQNRYFWVGLLLYVVSFFLTAVAGPRISSPPARGYHCAYYALSLSWDALYRTPDLWPRFEMVSLLISGSINVVFLLAAIVAFAPRWRLVFFLLRTIVVLMLPFCWIVFYYEQLYPREGYVLWTAGMLSTMFSQSLVGSFAPP
jgi:hypothetical protein